MKLSSYLKAPHESIQGNEMQNADHHLISKTTQQKDAKFDEQANYFIWIHIKKSFRNTLYY